MISSLAFKIFLIYCLSTRNVQSDNDNIDKVCYTVGGFNASHFCGKPASCKNLVTDIGGIVLNAESYILKNFKLRCQKSIM